MPKYTKYYNLKKPSSAENYDVDVANINNDIIDELLHEKVDKINGKGLSTNDFTNEYKKKIDSMQKLYRYRGSLRTYNELLQKLDNTIGDVYNILESNNNYCWNGLEWIELGINIDLSKYPTNESIKIYKYSITTETEIAENTDYEIPCYYKVGEDVLDIYYMGEKLIKDIHYKEIGKSGTISNKIQFYNWGQAVPTNRTIEFVVRGVYTNES